MDFSDEEIRGGNVTQVESISNRLALKCFNVLSEDPLSVLQEAVPFTFSVLSGVSLDSINGKALLSKIWRVKDKVKAERMERREAMLSSIFEVPRNNSKPAPKRIEPPTCITCTVVSDAALQCARNAEILEDKLLGSDKMLDERRKKVKEVSDELKVTKRKLQRREDGCSVLKRKLRESEEEIKEVSELLKAKTKEDTTKQKKHIEISTKLHALKEKCTEIKNEKSNAEKKVVTLREVGKKISLVKEDELMKLKVQMKQLKDENESLTRENCTLQQKISDISITVDYQEQVIADNAEVSLYDWENKRYTPEAVQTILSLQEHYVSNANIKPVMQTVANLCGVQIVNFPSTSTINHLRIRGLAVSQEQLSEVLPEKLDTTLHTDETRRKGDVLMAYAVTDKDKTHRVLGVKEMFSKSASDTLETLKECVKEISESCGIPEVGDRLIANIKNTMSDRASTEKLFNTILQDYRSSLLPQIISGYEKLPHDNQRKLSTMNNFFCGLHLLIQMAERFNTVVKKMEIEENMTPGIQKDGYLKKYAKQSESAGVRYVRTSTKLFAPGGADQFGVFAPFSQFVKEKGKSNGLVDFNHNRFNVVFVDGEYVHYLGEEICHFIQNVYGPTNDLMKAVLLDSKEPWCRAVALALGKVGKAITSPLWRLMEDKNVPMADMSTYYTDLLMFFREMSTSEESLSQFVAGESLPPLLKERCTQDNLWHSIFQEQLNLDSLVCQILKSVFYDWAVMMQRLVSDHLPSGIFHVMNQEMQEETASVVKHNKLCEELFGHYDRLCKLRPNALPITHEAHIMYQKNQTGQWLMGKNSADRDRILNSSSLTASKLLKSYQQRKASIQAKRLQNVKEKEREILAAKERNFKKIEKFTSDIMIFGLWQTPSQVDNKLSKIKKKTEKVKALKAQLRFRKEVLKQPADIKYFQFSSAQVVHPVEKLAENLKHLLNKASEVESAEDPDEERAHFLMGEKVRHKFRQGDNFTWSEGIVINAVPGFPSWFNIVYDEEPELIYTFKLMDDFATGDLIVISQRNPSDSDS